MALLEWSDEYLLGIDALDFEHKDLFERINDLYAMCALQEGAGTASDCLGRLHARLAAHFALEEKTMREMKNPTYAAHKAEHDAFLDEITEAVAEVEATTEEQQLEALASRVKEWLVAHITTADRKLTTGVV